MIVQVMIAAYRAEQEDLIDEDERPEEDAHLRPGDKVTLVGAGWR